jgi:hypothetical protein
LGAFLIPYPAPIKTEKKGPSNNLDPFFYTHTKRENPPQMPFLQFRLHLPSLLDIGSAHTRGRFKADSIVRDEFGTSSTNGDSVTIIMNLKIKES